MKTGVNITFDGVLLVFIPRCFPSCVVVLGFSEKTNSSLFDTGGAALNHVTYFRPGTIDEAIGLLNEEDGIFSMAGGTDLVVQMRDGRKKPKAVLDLSSLDLGGVEKEKGGWRIGATTTMTELIEAVEASSIEELSIVAQAAGRLGGHQIRNRATIGGNICNASPAADSVCALMALETDAVALGKDGERRIPFKELFNGPGQTALHKGELLTAVLVKESMPPESARVVKDYFKLGGRSSLVCAIASVAAVTVIQEDNILSCSVAMGSVAPTPWKARFPEQMLVGRKLSREVISDAASAAAAEISPIDDVRASGS